MQFQLPVLSLDFLRSSLPIILLSISAIFQLLMSVSKFKVTPTFYARSNMVVLVLCLVSVIVQYNYAGSSVETFLNGGFLRGHLGYFGQGLILSSVIVVSLLFGDSYLRDKFNRGEVLSIFQMVIGGMLTMVSTDDLVTLFVGLEMASIGVYALIGYMSPSKISQEGAIKYFILGSVAAAILLFGFAFLYAATGTLKISEISSSIGKISTHPWIELGAVLTIAGIGFKMALVPFHMWTPDAYEGAPTGLTAFMATAMKTMIVVASLRFFENGLDGVYSVWVPVVGAMAAGSLLFANIMAISQQSVKRLLAYSSISHSGYIALAIAAMSGGIRNFSVPSILFYLLAYTVVSLGTFAIVMWLENEKCENIIVDDLTGLFKQHPWAAVALTVLLFSLGGMPPTVGFISKFYVFNAALSNGLVGLTVIAAIGSTISLYYYLRIIVRMFMMESGPVLGSLIKPSRSIVSMAIVALSIVFIVAFGTFLPESALRIARHAATEVTGG